MITAPILTTDRLLLRPPRADDFDSVRAFGQSEERMRFLGGVADANAQWRVFLADIGHWSLRGYGLFSVEVRASGALAGRVGPIFHLHNDEPELAWHLFEGFDGHGYASEAALAARAWYYAHTGNGALMSWVNVANHASQGVARRLGAVIESEETTASGHTGQIWRHPGPA